FNHLVTVTHPNAANGSALTDNYVYDELGQRTAHWNSQMTSAVKETTDYDLQGRVARTADYLGYATTFGYTWNASLVTTGLGTYGGWAKLITQKDTAGGALRTATDYLDYFGRLSS